MFLLLVFLRAPDGADKLLGRLLALGLSSPWLLRARSAEQVLSLEVPMFAGLRGLLSGADEDRLLCVCPYSGSAQDVARILTRLQLELDADDPPSGQVVALPLLVPSEGTSVPPPGRPPAPSDVPVGG